MLNKEDQSILSEGYAFWNHLSGSEKELLIQNTTAVKFEKGSTIHRGDTDCIGVLMVKSGSLRTYMLSEEGREITLYRIYEGDVCILAASCILNAITFEVHIDAEEDCEILITRSCSFSHLSDQNIYVQNFTYKLATGRFSDVMWAMQQILFMSFDKRLAMFLLDEAAGSGSMHVHMTHEQIAKYLGSAREVVSRMLKYFAQEGMVELYRGGIHILDKKRLRELA